MKFGDIRDDASLQAFMTTPSDSLVRAMAQVAGDIIGLGATGKMGSELMQLIRNADRAAGVRRRYYVASTFSDPAGRKHMEALGIKTFRGDLSDARFLKRLPPARNVVYMAGFKFGTSGNYQRAYHLNVIMPYLVGERYRRSSIVCFSTANFYPAVDIASGGAVESTPVAPRGIYGWTALGREHAFRIIAEKHGTPLSFFRLGYAQHLNYGVLVDLAKMVKTQDRIELTHSHVCLVSQRDANEVAIESLGKAASPPWVVNCCGPVCDIAEIVRIMAARMGRKVKVVRSRGCAAHVQSDRLAVRTFGAYRDRPEEMIEAAVDWVMQGGKDWGKPTGFLSRNVY
jgi:nucleoside-diphosphate-sugar epimerase